MPLLPRHGNRVEHAARLVVNRGQRLGLKKLAGHFVIADEVGKGPTDIGGKADHGAVSSEV
jgi:hypothetical protein